MDQRRAIKSQAASSSVRDRKLRPTRTIYLAHPDNETFLRPRLSLGQKAEIDDLRDGQASGLRFLPGKVRQDRFQPLDRGPAVVRQRARIDVKRLLRDLPVVQSAEHHHFTNRLLLPRFEKTDPF